MGILSTGGLGICSCVFECVCDSGLRWDEFSLSIVDKDAQLGCSSSWLLILERPYFHAHPFVICGK